MCILEFEKKSQTFLVKILNENGDLIHAFSIHEKMHSCSLGHTFIYHIYIENQTIIFYENSGKTDYV